MKYWRLTVKFKAIFLFFSRIHATLSDSVGWLVGQSVSWSAGWSVHPSVRPSVHAVEISAKRLSRPHPYATDAVVYTPLLMKHLIQTNAGPKV